MLAINHPKKVIFSVLVISIILAYFIPGLKTNNDIDVWLDPDNPQLAAYHRFLETFGSEEFILVVMEKNDVFDPKDMAFRKDLGQQLEKISGISKVSSIADFYEPGIGDFVKFKQMVLSNPVFRKTWISKDARSLSLFIQLDGSHKSNRTSLVNQVRAALKKIMPEGERYHLAGPPVFNVTLDTYSRRAALIFSPLAFLLAGLIIWAIFRSFSWGTLSLMVAGIVIYWVLAVMALFHHDLNMVTSALPALLLVVSLSYSLRFFNAYQQEGSLGLASCRVKRPIFLSSLTTSLGFGSLVVSDIGPIRDFGLSAALGCILSYILVLIFLPASLGLLKKSSFSIEKTPRGKYMRRFLQWIGDFNLKRKRLILWGSILILVGVIVNISRLKIEVNALHFLKENNRMVQDYAFIEEHLMGLSPLEVVVKPQEGDPMSKDHMEHIRALQSFLEHQPEIVNTFSVLDWVEIGESLRRVASFREPYPGLIAEGLEKEMSRYVVPSGPVFRISCRVKTLSSSKYKGLMQRINGYSQGSFAGILETNLTGLVPLLINMQDSLFRSQIKSFLLAMTIIAAVMFLLVRSLKPFILAMIPNLWPIVITFGFMGLVQIPLDVATVMVASIAIGIAVDNTIHFIYRYREELEKGSNHIEAMYKTLHGVGQAMLSTSLVMASGFSILCLSQFKPMVYFGILSTVAIIAALLADLFLHPVLLILFAPEYKRRRR